MRKLFTFLIVILLSIITNAQVVVTTTIDFNTSLGMTDIGGTAPATAWSRVTTGTFPSISPQAGAGMAKFDSYNISSGLTRTLSTPVIDYSTMGCTYTKTVSFWMYRDNGYATSGDSISVYINTTSSLTGATYIERVARSISINQPNTQASNGWYQYTFNIPAGFDGATNYLLFKGTSRYGNNTYIDEIQYNSCTNACSGTPMAGTVGGSSTACNGIANNVSITASGFSSGTGLTFQWESSPNGTSGWMQVSGQTTASGCVATQTANTYYRLVSTCANGGGVNNTSAFLVSMSSIGCPATDNPCDAGELVVNTVGNDCVVSTTNTVDFAILTGSTAPVECSGVSTTDGTTRDFWHTVTVPAGGAVSIVSNNTNTSFWDMAIYTVATPCATPVFTQIASECVATTHPLINVTGRTPGEVLYIRMWRDQNSALTSGTRTYTLCANIPAVPPACIGATDYIAPAAVATNVVYQPNVIFTWNNVAGATQYDVYANAGTSPTVATTLLGTVNAQVGATSSANWATAAGSTTYVWYVVPKNTGGAATGCGVSNQFTTNAAPPPPANDECAGAVTLTVGAGFCTTPVLGTLVASTASTGPTRDCATSGLNQDVWYSVVVPAGQSIIVQTSAVNATSGNDIVIQAVHSSDNTCAGTLSQKACSDDDNPDAGPSALHSRMTIANPGTVDSTYFVRVFPFNADDVHEFSICAWNPSTGAPIASGANCEVATTVMIDSAQKYMWVPLRASNGELIAEIYPNGNKLGSTTVSYYLNSAAVRTDANGVKYLDRNITITPTTQPTSNVTVRLYYKSSELDALQLVSGAVTATNLNVTKTQNTCATSSNTIEPGSLFIQSANGVYNAVDSFITISVPSFSTFFLHGGGVALPVTLTNIKAEITGTTNTVTWTTATESNSRKFVIERSTNGTNYTAIGEVATRALNGNSTSALSYNFVDVNPVQGKQYYRLQMVDNGGQTKYSQIVTLRRGGGKIEIVDVRPNPTTGIVYFNVLGVSNNVNVAIRNLNGQTVIAKGLTQSNGFTIDLAALANGMYILEVIDVKTNEKANYKVIKN